MKLQIQKKITQEILQSIENKVFELPNNTFDFLPHSGFKLITVKTDSEFSTTYSVIDGRKLIINENLTNFFNSLCLNDNLNGFLKIIENKGETIYELKFSINDKVLDLESDEQPLIPSSVIEFLESYQVSGIR